MAAGYPPPAGVRARPAYLDDVFRGASSLRLCQDEGVLTAMPALRSPSHSISSLSSWRSNSTATSSTTTIPTDEPVRSLSRLRALTPSPNGSRDDLMSIRSIRSIRTICNHLTPRFGRLRSKLLRRNVEYPIDEVEETIETDIFIAAPPKRKDSLGWSMHGVYPQQPPSTSHSGSWANSRPETPSFPTSQPCYYAFARNCPGYVIGGTHGEACEACAKAGFLGAP